MVIRHCYATKPKPLPYISNIMTMLWFQSQTTVYSAIYASLSYVFTPQHILPRFCDVSNPVPTRPDFLHNSRSRLVPSKTCLDTTLFITIICAIFLWNLNKLDIQGFWLIHAQLKIDGYLFIVWKIDSWTYSLIDMGSPEKGCWVLLCDLMRQVVDQLDLLADVLCIDHVGQGIASWLPSVRSEG